MPYFNTWSYLFVSPVQTLLPFTIVNYIYNVQLFLYWVTYLLQIAMVVIIVIVHTDMLPTTELLDLWFLQLLQLLSIELKFISHSLYDSGDSCRIGLPERGIWMAVVIVVWSNFCSEGDNIMIFSNSIFPLFS